MLLKELLNESISDNELQKLKIALDKGDSAELILKKAYNLGYKCAKDERLEQDTKKEIKPLRKTYS